jgi:hypothetical protein
MSRPTEPSALTWHEANQRYLVASLSAVRAHLQKFSAQLRNKDEKISTDEPDSSSAGQHTGTHLDELQEMQNRLVPPPTVVSLQTQFQLTPFELSVVLLCAGMELDARFAGWCAAAQGMPMREDGTSGRGAPTFGLALAALPEAHWSALSPTRPLRYWRLVEFAPSGGNASAPLTTRPLRIDERVLHFLTGLNETDERLAGCLRAVGSTANQIVDDPPHLLPSQQSLGQAIAQRWHAAKARWPAVSLYGADVGQARAVACWACMQAGMGLQELTLSAVPTAPNDLEAFVRLLRRELILTPGALLVQALDEAGTSAGEAAGETARAQVLRELIAQIGERSGPLLIASRDRIRHPHRAVLAMEMRPPPAHEQHQAWQHALEETANPKLAERMNGKLHALASQFKLSASAIQSTVSQTQRTPVGHAGDKAADEGAQAMFEVLWDACRTEARGQLDGLAQAIEPHADWDDLVLPPQQIEILHDVVAHVRQRAKVYETWGFAAKSARGLGISALFSGASGTGKTLTAEVIASALRLDLYRIDLSSVVSKYIGETEKNLRRVFDAAEGSGAILLFDEADALFGKRSEVKDSHDRYANIEVSYLLQRMENYRGLAILTTNLKSALDTAFMRRIRFVVHFPFPDAAHRAEIWRRMFPRETPKKGLNYDRLAQLNVAGGNIRNIALNAAFLAADADQPVGMGQVLRAARAEYAKLEKLLTEGEILGWK